MHDDGFVHLRVRSAYSLLEGAIKADRIGPLAEADGAPAVAIADRANLFGALEFSEATKEAAVQPVIGCALPVTGIGERRPERWARAPSVMLLVQKETGWRNLMALSSSAYLEPPGDEPAVECMSVENMIGTTLFLTYTLADEVFALDIGKVREVLDFTSVTKVPNMPDFLVGVINLRGIVVPVVDLRTRFRMPRNEQTVNTCVIITEVSVDGDTTVLGALADSVQEVVDLEPQQIEPAPKIGTKLNTEFIRGMGKHNNRFIIILDIDKVFSMTEVSLVEALGAGAECPMVNHHAA